MDFVAVLDQVIALLRQRGRLTYRTLQLQYQLDDAHLEALKDELIEGQRLAVDEAGRVLVWAGVPEAAASGATPAPAPLAYTPPYLAEKILTSRRALEGERGAILPRVESGCRFRCFHCAIARRRCRDQRIEQLTRRRHNLVNGSNEGRFIRFGRMGKSAQFSYVLKGRVPDLFLRRGWLEIMQSLDVSTHDDLQCFYETPKRRKVEATPHKSRRIQFCH